MGIIERLSALRPRRADLERNYSQYAEDAVLFAVLKPVGPGFYVDVGAHYPCEGSNTYRLYRNGWRGITVEPNPEPAGLFRAHRPRDRHVVEGVSRAGGALTYAEYGHSVFNTFSAARVEKLRTRDGIAPKATRTIGTRPLRDILSEHAVPHIDFLTIDCEGLDMEVLETADLASRRPTAVLIEDFDRYYGLRLGEARADMSAFMRAHDYQPVAQALLSTLYIAKDWRELFKLSTAYDEDAVQGPLLP